MEQPNQFFEENSNSLESNIEITDVQWHYEQEKINFNPKVVDTLSKFNDEMKPAEHEFKFSWSTTEEQTTIWSEKSSMGKNFEYEVKLPDRRLGCDLKIAYYDNTHNISTTSVFLSLNKCEKDKIAPKTTATAQLKLLKSEIVELPFTATIKCFDVNGRFSECKVNGTWRGTLYDDLSSSRIDVVPLELDNMM